MKLQNLRVIVLGGLLIAAFATHATTPNDAALLTWAAEQGYQRLAYEGKPVYCRLSTPTGTHIERAECVSEMVLADRKYLWDHRNPYAR